MKHPHQEGMSQRNHLEESDSSEQKKTDIWESQDISDWLVRSSVLNPGQMGRFPHNLDFLRGDAGVGHTAQKEADSLQSITGLACRNGHSSLSSSS